MTPTASFACRRPRHRHGLAAWLFALTILPALAASPGTAQAAPAQYRIDPNHLSIGFMVWHIGYERVLGQFAHAEGTFTFDEDAPALSDLRVTIDATSISTHHDRRDEHLRGTDFLDTAQFPTITFVGTGAERTGERTGRITGDLTLHGVTRPVTLEVTWNKSARSPLGGNYVTGISARATIRRSEFGMTYAVANNLVGDEVEVIIELEAIRQ